MAEPDSLCPVGPATVLQGKKKQQTRDQGSPKKLSTALLDKRQWRKQELDQRGPGWTEEATKTEEVVRLPWRWPAWSHGSWCSSSFRWRCVRQHWPARPSAGKRSSEDEGNLTMVTLQNHLQVLECQKSQQGQLEERHGEQDAGQVHDLETKIKWITWLSKMYCVMMFSNM
ncbi:Surfeit locus protein 6 [Sciurus carolinensis]|uniref:Surfeit locus protein 6 n=1 Tax=Sciurus carolinensis TaxID=30640 RepID=A0AA41MIM1_SCICA|nr:Surfeit locus protein 6 [Sciurus carolinensis]